MKVFAPNPQSTLRRAFAIIALALVLLPLAASAPLFDPDEGLHAAIAQEMVLRGDYVTPTFLGEPFLDKPILFFWTEAASLRVFGNHEAAVRLPPVLFGLLGMLSVAWLGRELFGESAGVIAGIAYGSMLLPLGVSEVAVHDVGLAPFMCVAVLCLKRATEVPPTPLVASAFPGPSDLEGPGLSDVEGRRKIWMFALVAGIALGLSILTKGLVGVVFAGIFAASLAWQRPSAMMRLAIVLAGAFVVAMIVAAPWYIAMERAHAGYLHYYFVERHLQGYLTATQRHAGRPWWYYGPIVIGGALPWTAYLAGAARSVRTNPMLKVLWSWFAIGLAFLSIGESKLVTYALPLFPALALIAGEYIDRTIRGFHLRVEDRLFKVAFVTQVATLAVLPCVGLGILEWKFGARHPFLWAGTILLGALIVETARRAWSTADYGLVDGIVRLVVLSVVGLTLMVAPAAAEWMTARDLAKALNGAGALPSHVWVLDERIGSLIFYLDPALRAEATGARVGETSLSEGIGRMRVDADDAILAVRNTQLERFTRLFSVPPTPYAQAGTFTLYRADRLRDALRGR